MGFSSLIAGRSSKTSVLIAIGFALILNGALSSAAGTGEISKIHIVYLGARQHEDPELVTASHHTILESVFGSKDAARKSMIYSYRHGFSGFAAKLNSSQVKALSAHPDVVHVAPNRILQLKTTRSFDYLGLSPNAPKGLLHDTNMGSDAIIGVIDSGIWPEAESFNDKGLSPIPTRWKGGCVSGESFDATKSCNKKLIGAKFYFQGVLKEVDGAFNFTEAGETKSPRDVTGHGTHVTSIAAGSFVPGASVEGLAGGTARGGAPGARVATYKVCWKSAGCPGSDLVKAIDDAIHDRVDVISISIGNRIPNDFEVDPRDIGIASFHAVMEGIPVVCAAGNEGPGPQTVDNVAPWIITVAASTMDRSFPIYLTLGNNLTMMAQGLYTGNQTGFVDLVYGGELPDADIKNGSVMGKIVLIFMASDVEKEKLKLIVQGGSAGVIMAQSIIDAVPCFMFPCVSVDYELGTDILYYIQSTASPKIKISPTKTVVGRPIATKIPTFSNRGPNSISPAILKPDIAAPGADILGAVPGSDPRQFDLLSGTSMAAPAVSGVVALLRAKYPQWSPAAIRSALVTTAWRTDPFGFPIMSEGASPKPADPFDYGGGIMNPERAANPGLVYDMGYEDYVHYLCSAGYQDKAISSLLGKVYTCPNPRPSILDVNLPSITVPDLKEHVTVTRTVTNVGTVDSVVYKPVVESPYGVKVVVNPKALVFNSTTKKATFKVHVSTTNEVNSAFFFGSLTWTDGTNNVTIPLSVRTKIWQYSV
ncbi:PREDICTED: subtilisin-like protease SBT3.17 [Tarenaya hassleriana]|uniref:subtilisin-like protease SBT3.17 n=1 Tax=Tarenaya hassleriana TaxID=28532 RepID=UPI00053C73C4|nr:PREDICTED: subtilisin-like protease SBT3.17 [Tarenaya hassleriana]